MCSREIIKELKNNKHLGMFQHKSIRNRIDINLNNKLLPLNNPYVGVFPWSWTCKVSTPTSCDKSTQTEECKYYQLGLKVATAYGDDWEILHS